ncbi:hypothetical protein IAU59_001941 [Kwoniella sp. CBS 9459]
MAPITAAEKQKLLLQQEIAKLSGAISRHSTTGSSSSYHPYRGRPAPRGYPSTSTSRGRGRGRGGRGGSYALDLRQVNKIVSTSSAEPSRPSSAASVNPPSSSNAPEEGELPPVSSDPDPDAGPPAPSVSNGAVAGPSGSGWVKGKGKGGNMSLMTVEKRDQLRIQQKQRKPKLPAQIQMLSSTAVSSGDKRVVIDGVIFQFEQDGKKLTRIGEAPSSSGSGGVFTPTRKSLNFGGGKYRRTMKGNLILKKTGSPVKSQQLCRYFTKTGRCNFGLTCPHIHDPARVSICPRYLRGTCTLGTSCPLSHTPSPHNTPSCLRFQATSSCSVPNCPYPHVKVSADAPVCEAFARGGWCPKEAGECEELHVWECPEFRSKGTCPKGGKCGLRHVVRAENGRAVAQKQSGNSKETEGGLVLDTVGEEVPAGGFEEQDDFVQFDQGSPEAVFSADEDEGVESKDEAEGEGEEEGDSEMESELAAEEDQEDDEDGVTSESEDEGDLEETMSNSGSNGDLASEEEDVEGDGRSIIQGGNGYGTTGVASAEPKAVVEQGKQSHASAQAQVQTSIPSVAPAPAPAPPHVPSDNLDTDEVDEDAVLSVV